MEKPKVLAMAGGICKDSINKKLLGLFEDNSAGKFDVSVFEIANLPYFSQDIENNPPEIVKEFKKQVTGADAILIATPEYNRSFPGVLKNALDWGSRPYGTSVWTGKPTGLMGASIGAIGAFGAQNHLKQVLSYLDMDFMRQPEFYFTFTPDIEKGNIPDGTLSFLKSYIEAFEQWIARNK